MQVESQKMAEQRLALENYSKAVEEQRNRLGQVKPRVCISHFTLARQSNTYLCASSKYRVFCMRYLVQGLPTDPTL